MTEEEVKAQIVLPLLASLGVDVADLQLETTFSVRLGRQLHNVGGARPRDALARLDILVKRAGRNLFIIETKRSDLALTDDDRDQAISYARLFDQIAPYALVTNGNQWRLYDVVTKAEVTAADIRFPDGYSIALPEDIKHDALRVFLRASPDNVRLLCQHQVAQNIAPFRGSAAERTKPYVPDLQVSRPELTEAVDRFYQSPKPLFVLIGESGCGKTCSLCSLALSFAEASKPVFFLSALTLEHGISDAVAAEFNWTFADAQSSIQTLKRLHELDLGSPMTLIVDAVDEWPYSGKVANLLWLARHAEPHRLRMVVSCKLETWPSFLEQVGTPTGLDACVYTPAPGDESRRPAASYLQSGFSEPEFNTAVAKYRRLFGYQGSFDETTLAEARRDPLLLRVLFEVAATSGVDHLDLSTTSVLAQYIRQRLTRMQRPEQADNTLMGVAGALFARNTEWIAERELRQALGLGVNDRIEPGLFDHSVLLRRPTPEGPEIGFSMAQLRNFLIAEVVCRWPTLQPAAFQATVEGLQPDGLHAEVLKSYYRRAPEPQKRMLDGQAFAAAETYLGYYADILQEHFPSLWRSFPGCGTGAPAFYGEFHVPQLRLLSYGFRSSTAGTPPILLRGVDSFEGDRFAAYSFQVETLQWAGDLTNDAPDLRRKVVANEIIPALKNLIDQGALVEEATPDLILELLLAAVARGGSSPFDGPIFRGAFGRFWDTSTRRLLFPIAFDAILESFHREELRRHIESDLIDELRPPGSSGFAFTPAVLAEIDRRLQAGIARGDPVPEDRKFMDVERLKKWLPHAIEFLRTRMPSLEPSPLPQRPNHRPGSTPGTREDWEAYLQQLYTRYLSNYRVLVETNFPTLKDSLPLYGRMPLREYLMIESTPTGRDDRLPLTILTSKEQPAENEIVVAQSIEPEDLRNMVFRVDRSVVEAEVITRTREPGPWADAPNPLKYRMYGCPLRQMVYGTLKKELTALLASLRAACGIGA